METEKKENIEMFPDNDDGVMVLERKRRDSSCI